MIPVLIVCAVVAAFGVVGLADGAADRSAFQIGVGGTLLVGAVLGAGWAVTVG